MSAAADPDDLNLEVYLLPNNPQPLTGWSSGDKRSPELTTITDSVNCSIAT